MPMIIINKKIIQTSATVLSLILYNHDHGLIAMPT